MPWMVSPTEPWGAQTAPAVTGWNAVVGGAIVLPPTVLGGLVTTVGGGVVAAVVGAAFAAGGVVLTPVGGVVALVEVAAAAVTDAAELDLALFELLEQPVPTSASTVAAASDHLKEKDVMTLSPFRRLAAQGTVDAQLAEACHARATT